MAQRLKSVSYTHLDVYKRQDQNKLIEASINGMLQSLDPHSSYMTANDWKDMQQSTKGEYGGLGLEVTSDAGAVKVIAPMAGSPGERAGIVAGDRIIAIDGVNIVGSTLSEAVEKMKGKPNTTVEITVVHEGQDPKPVSYTHLDVYKRQLLRLKKIAPLPLPFPPIMQRSQQGLQF